MVIIWLKIQDIRTITNVLHILIKDIQMGIHKIIRKEGIIRKQDILMDVIKVRII